MNFLFDIGHPAHIYLYKNTIRNLKEKGHSITVTAKKSATIENILNQARIRYHIIGQSLDGNLLKGIGQINNLVKLRKIIKEKKISIAVGSTLNIALLSKIAPVQTIVLDDDDDEVQPLFTRFGHPYCTHLLSPDVLKNKRNRKSTLYYPGYHELAYLHPNEFKPDPNIPLQHDIDPDKKYFILRFNSFKAHHDVGAYGISYEQKLELIDLLKPYGNIYISCEREIEPEIEEYYINIPSEAIHSVLAFATMFIGDSQTMTSEAAVLGTPAIRCNSFVGKISYLEEEEHKYELTYGFHPKEFESLKQHITRLLEDQKLKDSWSVKKRNLLKDKIDVSNFLTWFLEHLPDSGLEVVNNQSVFKSFH